MRITFERRHAFKLNQQVTVSGTPSDDGNFLVTQVVDPSTIDVDKIWSGMAPGSNAFVFSYGTANDLSTDQQLIDAAIADETKRLLILDASGGLVANRFVPPPDFKHSLAKFQDRMFYGADNLDGVGEITTTADSTTVTFTNPVIPSNAVGQILWIPTSAGTTQHRIEQITSTTTVLVYPPTPAAVTTSEYSLRPDETERNTIYYSEIDEPESVPRTNKLTIQEQTEDEDEIVGLHSFGAYLYILKQRHIYTLSFARQPRIDAQARLLTHRGAFNKNCWAVFEGQAYVMDQSGIYILNLDGSFRPISGPIQNFFRNDLVDFAKSKWFFTSIDYNSAVARFHVAAIGESGNRPTRAICYSIRYDKWWTESYPFMLAGSAMSIVSNRPELLSGGQADLIVNFEKQEAEMVDTEIRGTVSSATPTTLTDDAAAFTDELIGSTVGILFGPSSYQVRTITDVTSPTTVEIGDPTATEDQMETQANQPLFFQDDSPWFPQASSPGLPGQVGSSWDNVPVAGETYIIGAILWQYRSKQYLLPPVDRTVTSHLDIDFLPTENAYDFRVSFFYDDSAKAEGNFLSYDFGDGVSVLRGNDYRTILTTLNRSLRGETIGDDRLTLQTQVDKRVQSHRRIAYVITGVKGEDQMFLDTLDINQSPR